MNSLYETEVLQSQRGQPDQDTGGSDSRKNKTNKFSGRTKVSSSLLSYLRTLYARLKGHFKPC